MKHGASTERVMERKFGCDRQEHLPLDRFAHDTEEKTGPLFDKLFPASPKATGHGGVFVRLRRYGLLKGFKYFKYRHLDAILRDLIDRRTSQKCASEIRL